MGEGNGKSSTFTVKQKRTYSSIQVSPAWRLDREMRKRLILQEIGSTRLRFFTSYFIDANTFYLFMN